MWGAEQDTMNFRFGPEDFRFGPRDGWDGCRRGGFSPCYGPSKEWMRRALIGWFISLLGRGKHSKLLESGGIHLSS